MQILSLSQSTVGEITVGHVVNLASNDIRLIDDVITITIIEIHYSLLTSVLQAFYGLPSLLIYPFLLVAATAIMYYTIGVYAFLAIGVTVTFIPLQIILTKVYHKLRQADYRLLIYSWLKELYWWFWLAVHY